MSTCIRKIDSFVVIVSFLVDKLSRSCFLLCVLIPIAPIYMY